MRVPDDGYRTNRQAVCARYREKNAEKIKASRKRWKEANPDRVRDINRRHYEKHREKMRTRNGEYAEQNPDKIRDNNLRRTGFTARLIEATISLQGGLCPICGCDLASLPRKHVHADHCHFTTTPRGVLCHSCNTGIGSLRDDVALLRKAIAYLEKPPLHGVEHEEMK